MSLLCLAAARRRSSIELFLAESREELAVSVSEGGTVTGEGERYIGGAAGSTHGPHTVREALGAVLAGGWGMMCSLTLVTFTHGLRSLYDLVSLSVSMRCGFELLGRSTR